VLLLFALFAAPMVAAYLWHPDPNAATTNYGQLVTPARPLDDMPLLDLDGKPAQFASLKGKWTLLYAGGENCDKVCTDSLYKIERVRLTQNKNIDRVQSVYIVPSTVDPQSVQRKLRGYEGLTGLRAGAATEATMTKVFESGGHGPLHQRIYIIDPLGNLMMSYPADADPTGMRKDLARLLKASQIG